MASLVLASLILDACQPRVYLKTLSFHVLCELFWAIFLATFHQTQDDGKMVADMPCDNVLLLLCLSFGAISLLPLGTTPDKIVALANWAVIERNSAELLIPTN